MITRDHKLINKLKQKHSKNGVRVSRVTSTPLTINDIQDLILDLGEHRSYIMELILAVQISVYIGRADPVWLMVVGNPSSNKTTLVQLLNGHDDVVAIDTLTSNPFISGKRTSKKEPVYDLLPKLDGKCFVIKEYGAFFGRSDEMVKQLLGDLTAIYDGEYSKHSSERDTIKYRSYFSHIGCVTPSALSKRNKYMNAVGARFVFLRIPSLSENEKDIALSNLWTKNIQRKTKQEISALVGRFIAQIKQSIEIDKPVIQFSDGDQLVISTFAKLIANARGIALTEERFEGAKKKIHHVEIRDVQIEEPFRAIKQLIKIAQSLAIVNERTAINKDDLWILRQVVLSSMPKRRADVLRIFEKKDRYTVAEASILLGDRSKRTVRRQLEELTALNVLDKFEEENQKAFVFILKEQFQVVFDMRIWNLSKYA